LADKRPTPAVLPPETLLPLVSKGDTEVFLAVGREFLGHFRELCDLRPDERVLDIGCGLGRVAIPLTGYLTAEGGYEGFDIDREAIHWCNEHITGSHPNFRFRLADLFSQRYNPGGHIRAADFEFPYRDGEFDFAFASSVFTHMLPEDMERYFAEVARVLKPGGRWLATFFLLNDESLRSVEAGTVDSTLGFDNDFGTYRVTFLNEPEGVVGYREDFVVELYERFGFAIRKPIEYGAWPGRKPSLTFQDLIVANAGGLAAPGQ
jgi:SAM-dependent methyltransferase